MATTPNKLSNIVLSDTRIFFRNFRGEIDKFNKTGARSFCCEVPVDLAKELSRDGINIKFSKDTTGMPDPDRPYIKVKVRYDIKPPSIFMIVGKKMTLLTEDALGVLDNADIERADLIVEPVYYDVNGNTGYSTYIKKAYITIQQDEFADRYSDMEIA